MTLSVDKFINDGGYQQVISTLTAVSQRISEQKFFEIAPADYMPVIQGEGAFSDEILNWKTASAATDFEDGVMQNGANDAKSPDVSAEYSADKQPVFNWAKGVPYSLFELEQARRANTLFSIIEAKELSRVKNWQLGVQKVAFEGSAKLGLEGLLNQSSVAVDGVTISKYIKDMTPLEFDAFIGSVYEKYRANCQRTAKPTHFVIPETDYNGLANFPDSTYPLKTRLQIIEESFRLLTRNPSFQVLPCAYGDVSEFGAARYALYNSDPTSVKMDIPIDYTQTETGTWDGMHWRNIAYGQFTGVIALRPLEMIYFSHAG